MPGRAILIAGYPGSGKSTYGEKLRNATGAVQYVDDYHWKSAKNNSAFDHGREFNNMTEGIRRGETWIASDITWCKPQKRQQVERALREVIPDIIIEWHFIKCDEDVCRERIRSRGLEGVRDVKKELQLVDELALDYHIPSGAKIILC